MNIMNNLNPNFYKTVIEANNGRRQEVIYSTLNKLEIIAADNPFKNSFPDALAIDGGKDIRIFADVLSIVGKIKIPGGNITIVARKIVLPEIDQQPSLDITPDPIPDPTDPKDDQKVINIEARPFDSNNAKQNTNNRRSPVSRLDFQFDHIDFQIAQPAPIVQNLSGADGKPGAIRGKDAGTIKIVAEELQHNGKVLTLIANGGQGQIGQGGMNGTPTKEKSNNGVGFVPNFDKLSVAPQFHVFNLSDLDYHVQQGIRDGWGGFLDPWYDGNKPEIASNGSNGGAGGAGSDGGDGGNISVSMPIAKNVNWYASGGKPGADGKPGKGTLGTRGGVLTVKIPSWDSWGGITTVTSTVVGTINLTGGIDGVDGEVPDRNANPGLGKNANNSSGPVTDEILGRAFDSTYLLKLLQHAKNLYVYQPPFSKSLTELRKTLASDREKLAGYSRKIRKCCKKLNENPNQSVKGCKKEDCQALAEDLKIFDRDLQKLMKESRNNEAFTKLEWLSKVLSALELDEKADAESTRKKELLTTTNNLLIQFHSGVDAFGKTETWVPRRALSNFKKDLTETATLFKNIEEKFIKYAAEAEVTAEKSLDLSDVLKQIKNTSSLVAAKIDELTLKIPDLVLDLDAYSLEMSEIKSNIQSIIETYEYDVENYIDCSLANIFKALEMIAFDPENMVMAGVQAGNLLNKSINEIDGVKKDYIINKFKKIEGDLSDPDLSKEIFDDPEEKTEQLILDIESFERELAKVEADFPKDRDDLKAAVNDLKFAMKMRSKRLIEYNITLALIQKYQTELATLDSKYKNIKAGISKDSDPTMTGTVSYLAVMYQNVREQMMESVAFADRALQYWTIDSQKVDSVFDQFRNKVLWTGSTTAPSGFNSDDLENAINQIIKKVGNQAEQFGRSPQTIPSDSTVDGDIKFIVNDDNSNGLLERFRSNHKLNLKTVIEAVGDNEFTVQDPSETNKRYNIRVNYVRPRLIFSTNGKEENIKNGHDSAMLEIKHLGKGRIYNKGLKSYMDFSCDPVSANFKQSFQPLPNKRDFGDDGDGSFRDTGDSSYALLGLYGEWCIALNSAEKVDLSKLIAIEIEFGCEAYPF